MKRVGQLLREGLADQIKRGIEDNQNVFVLSYSQISGNKINELRKSLIQSNARMCVSRNRIARIALKDLKQEQLAEAIGGQTAFVWSNTDSVEISKILVKFAKEFDQVSVKGGVLDGSFLQEAQVKKLADLPSRNVLLAQLLGTIQAPVTQFMGALNAKSRELLSILNQYSEKKGGNENG